jgi:hypothetical protein
MQKVSENGLAGFASLENFVSSRSINFVIKGLWLSKAPIPFLFVHINYLKEFYERIRYLGAKR